MPSFFDRRSNAVNVLSALFHGFCLYHNAHEWLSAAAAKQNSSFFVDLLFNSRHLSLHKGVLNGSRFILDAKIF